MNYQICVKPERARMETEFTAKWERDIYRSDDYAVAFFYDEETDKTYKCVGHFVPSLKNVRYNIKAHQSKDEKYGGDKYEIISAEISACKTKKEIIGLLSSGLFPGIGKAMAERIYNKFKERSIEIIEEHAEELICIKGISQAKIRKIVLSYRQNKIEAEAYAYLAPYGFTLNQVHQIKKMSPIPEVLDFIRSDPYSMMEVRGVTFDMADMVALDNLIPRDDLKRVEAATVQIIKNMMSNGHTGCEYLPVAVEVIKMLKTDKLNAKNIKSHILELINRDKIGYRRVMYEGKEILYLYIHSALNAENELSNEIKKCIDSKKKHSIKNIEWQIEAKSREFGIQLDESQKQAIKNALNNNFSVITGGPGTGKTTIIRIIAAIWEDCFRGSSDIVLMSPTGRAARRMSEATGRHAATIHSTLRFGLTDSYGVRKEMSEENIIEDSLVVIDECSMIDLFLARDMMTHLRRCTVILVGDADQLPPVGCGQVLEDIIKSDRVPVSKLTYTHRQNKGSAICENADRIKRGITKLRASSDFSMIVSKDSSKDFDYDYLEKLENRIIAEYQKLLPEYGIENIAILCPYNKHKAGQLSINKRLQEMLNPYNGSREFKGKNGLVFRSGDPVMQLVNEDDVSNGDVGKVITVDKVDGIDTLVVKYYDCVKSYTINNIENITLAYAMTVHKSQGSEYDAIITCLADMHGPMIRRNIIYTAITRAKKKVVFCGSMSALEEAIQNNSTDSRNTLLWYNLRTQIENKNKVIDFKKETQNKTVKEANNYGRH